MPNKPEKYRPIQFGTGKRKRENRKSAHGRGYNARWQRESKLFLQRVENRLCAECAKAGAVVVAEVVDHRIPHRGDMVFFWDVSNWQGLCKRCHNRKSAQGQ